ncbi:MAG: menaquinone biosynthesis decarboxylase [Methylacidiphilales bacterium]|nr:menaquinone biosynthesis decarboxylase [Candidatus Methylacidiphilales bacterium]MDW8348652.1 menaquinone biosynthesis decarboxylase [Verrucomicrobiae bacterium]
MAYGSLADFVRVLEERGELIRISDPVSTHLEITALADREMKSKDGGKALLIEKPVLRDGKISQFPVLINAFGSHRRTALSIGQESIEPVVSQVAYLLKAKPPQTFTQAWELLRNGINLIHTRPTRVRTGPCKEVIHLAGKDASFDLHKLPILHCWPKDGGPFITLPNVYTVDPDTGTRNIGMYRMQVFDGWTTAMHWQIHKVAARHGKRYYETGTRMPVAVCLGGDPVLTFAATAPMPDGLDELLLAGFLRKKSIPLVQCETIELEVPAESDFVIEGYIDPKEPLRDEGPFGDHTGFYTPVDQYPAFHVTAITHRRDAIYPATIVGRPPMEDFYLGTASVKLFLPVFQLNFPEIVDMALPAEGVFHNLVFVSIRKQYPWQAYKVMHGLWGMGQMMFAKIIVVVDAHVNVHDTSEVLFYLCANVDPQRDTIFVKNPSDALDHAPSLVNMGSHLGIDATRKLPAEGYNRPWPEEIRMPEEVCKRVFEKVLRRW